MLQLFERVPELRELRVVCTHDGVLVRGLIDEWHSFRSCPAGWRIAFMLTDGIAIYGVSIFGRPVARCEDQVYTLEHTRMALGPHAPRNSASFFMAGCRRWIRRHMPEIVRLISYVPTRRYSGVTYRADNWHVVFEDREATGRSWANRSGRGDVGNDYSTKFEREP